MMPKKPKANHQIENSKISSIDLIMRCIDSKRSNDMMYMKPNEKLLYLIMKVQKRVQNTFERLDPQNTT